MIGLGPGFVARVTVDLAVETSWDDLGSLVTDGPTRALAGEPRPLGGHARDRYVYAPHAGPFRTERRIGEVVDADTPVAVIGKTILVAPIAGALRGLTRSGVAVEAGTKVIEIDPRPSPIVVGIGERPGRIADAVLRAILRDREHIL